MTSDPSQIPVSRQHDHTSRYEALRAHAVARQVPTSGDGLVVVLRQGVAAWMAAWSRLPPPRPMQAERPSPLPDETNAAVIHILAAMTLSHIDEVLA